jgi:selenocysteine lyase/cysteine desulfurase
VPTSKLTESITEDVSIVAVPAVQSATGERLDLSEIASRCVEVGARLIVDATQALGWLPLDLKGIDALICSGYKWLLCPRGVAFGVLSRSMMASMRPIAANWFAGKDPHSSYYGLPLRLSETARRFDISPAWFSWVGAEESLRYLGKIGVAAIFEHDLALVREFWRGAGREGDESSAIVSVRTSAELEPSGVPFRSSRRDGGMRLSFHLYNTVEEAAAAGRFLAPYLC